MSALLPGFGDQLEARATELATDAARDARQAPHASRHRANGAPDAPGPRHARRRRRLHGRGLVVAVLAGMLGAGGVAYAAKSIWSPQLGNPRSGEPLPTASTSPVPPEQRALLGVLRRPQTAADRSAGTLDALKVQFKEMQGVRLDAVRLLGKTADGGAIVLIPVKTAKSVFDSVEDRTDALCLWVAMPEGGSQGCPSMADLRAGRMKMTAYGPPPEVVREQMHRLEERTERQKAEARRQGLTFAEYLRRQGPNLFKTKGGRTPRVGILKPPDTAGWETNVVQVVPDGVAFVRYRANGKVHIDPVRGNVAIVHIKPATSPGLGLAWLDAQGHELYQGQRFPQRKPPKG